MNETATNDRVSTAHKLITHLTDVAQDVPVADVRIGLGYIAVKLADERTGVAYTFRDLAQGPLNRRLRRALESRDAIEAGIGLACANALANRHDPDQIDGDILEHLEVGPDDNVAMVGHFGPLVEKLRQRARSLTIFERVSEPTDLLRPQEEALDLIPRSQIALITATSIINQTIDGLLDAARGCRHVALLGASTPLVTEAFDATGVTMLSGVIVTEPSEVLRVVSEGGGMRQFSPHVRKVNMKLKVITPN